MNGLLFNLDIQYLFNIINGIITWDAVLFKFFRKYLCFPVMQTGVSGYDLLITRIVMITMLVMIRGIVEILE